MTLEKVHPYVWLAGAAALALWLITRKGAALNAGAAAGAAVVDAGAGLVLGAGDAVGLPRTDTDECAAAIAAGNLWGASFACPAGDFLGAVLDAAADDENTGSVTGSW